MNSLKGVSVVCGTCVVEFKYFSPRASFQFNSQEKHQKQRTRPLFHAPNCLATIFMTTVLVLPELCPWLKFLSRIPENYTFENTLQRWQQSLRLVLRWARPDRSMKKNIKNKQYKFCMFDSEH